MFDWSIIIWLFGAFLAISSFLKLSNARTRSLHDKLNEWLKAELRTIQQKKRLLKIAREKRAQLKLQQELQAAQVQEEIKKLEISKMLAEKAEQDRIREKEIAEKAKEIKEMRNRVA